MLRFEIGSALPRSVRLTELRARAVWNRRPFDVLVEPDPQHLDRQTIVEQARQRQRFQQTLKNWLRVQPVQPATVTELQTLLDDFVQIYNQHRPHRSLPHRATPATVYNTLPEATPSSDRTDDTPDCVRHDKIDDGAVTLRVNGRLHHIGVGRTHARTPVSLLVQDLDVRVVNAATGELLRELTIDPRRDYQPTGQPPRPPHHHK